MMDNFTPPDSLTDQIQLVCLALADLESDLRSAESVVEFELLMMHLNELRKALELLQ